MVLICFLLLLVNVMNAKDFISTPEFTTWKVSLSTKEVTEGIAKALSLVESTNQMPISHKNRNYIRSQLSGLEFRLNIVVLKMNDLGIPIETNHQTLKRKRASDSGAIVWNPFPTVLGPLWEFFGAESKNDHDLYKEEVNERIRVLEMKDKEIAGVLKRTTRKMASGLRNVELNLNLIANSSALVKQTNRVKAALETTVISAEFALQTFIEIKDRADNNLASRNVVTKENLRNMNVDANDNFKDLHPIFSNNEVENYFSLPIGP